MKAAIVTLGMLALIGFLFNRYLNYKEKRNAEYAKNAINGTWNKPDPK